MSLSSLMTDTITITRKGPTHDTSGGVVQNFVPVVGMINLPASIQPRTGKHHNTLGQRQVLITHHIYQDQGYDIRRGDMIVDGTGKSYVTHGYENQGGRNVCWRIECVLET